MLRRNLIANYLGQGWAGLMSFAFIPLYIRYLGIESYGLIGLFAALQLWLMLLDLGMAPTLSREMARFSAGRHSAASIRDVLRSAEVLMLLVAALLAGSIWAASGWLARSWFRPEGLSLHAVANSLAAMGFVTALRLVEGVYRSSLIGLQRQVPLNVTGAAVATLRHLGAVGVLVWISSTLWAFFLWQGAVSLISIATLARIAYASLPPGERAARFSTAALADVRRFAGGAMGVTLLALLLTQVDRLLLSRLLTLTDDGYYILAATVAGMIFVLVTPISQAWYPRLSELHAAGHEARFTRNYHQGAQLVSVTAGSVAIVLICFSYTFLSLWTRDPALSARAAPLLSILMVGNLLNSQMWIPYQAQLACGLTRLGIKANAIAVVVFVPAVLIVTPRYGAEGAAWVWLALNFSYVTIGIHFTYRLLLQREKRSWYANDMLKPLLSSAVAVGLLKWLMPEPDTAMGALILLALAGVASVVSSVVAANLVLPDAIVVCRRIASSRGRAR